MAAWTAEDRRLWRAELRALREKCPPRHPVVVRRRRDLEDFGYTDRIPGRRPHFLILIDAELEVSVALHFLVHEWAHALAWPKGDRRGKDHDRAWGLAVPRAYSVVFPDEP